MHTSGQGLNFSANVKITKAHKNSFKLQQSLVKHTLKFASLYTPASFKDMSLFFRGTSKYNSFLKNKPNKKILVKQSYVMLIWLSYIAKSHKASDLERNDLLSKASCPSFFIYPFRNYKTTITKAPMAHKTYSQEQFMIRFYKFSISFHTNLSIPGCINSGIPGVNSSLFFSSFLRQNMPILGTNMLILHKYTTFFYSLDKDFFSLNLLKKKQL
jgi:hypothetical protein